MIQFPIFSVTSIGFSVSMFATTEAVAAFLAQEGMALKPDSFAPAGEQTILAALKVSTRRVNVFYPVGAPDFAYRVERHEYFSGR